MKKSKKDRPSPKKSEVQFGHEPVVVYKPNFATFGRYDELRGLPYVLIRIKSNLGLPSRWLALVVRPDKLDVKIGESKSRAGAIDLCRLHFQNERKLNV